MDVLRLIECVRQHVYLYDINDKMYKNVGLKTWAWESVAEELNETTEAVRLKWKTIRDGYMKYKKQLKIAESTGSFTKVPDYIWSHHLKFLDTHQMSRKKSEAFSKAAKKTYTTVDSHSSATPLEVLMPSLQTIPTSSSTGFLLVEPLQQGINPQITVKRRNENETEATNKKMRMLNHDATDYLFLSYAQTFKKFSLRQQAVMKMELAKMFSRAELAELDNSNFEPVNSNSFYVQPVGTNSVGNAESPTTSIPSSSCSNNEQTIAQANFTNNTIKEELAENSLPGNFHEHIVP